MTDAPPGGAQPSERPEPMEAEDPLAADKRTLAIGAASMVGLILVGVVSAQLFARGGCAAVVDPRPAPASAAADDPGAVVDEVLGNASAANVLAAVEGAAGAPVVTAVPVGDATDVVPLGDGLLTTGGTVTSFDATLTPTATYTTTDLVVGDGGTVFDVVVPNEVTGQTDALIPLTGADLAVGTCVDTAVVGSPFAFLLDAGDGQLLLLRAEEDGDSPELQLRDGEGVVWDARIALPVGPPGTQAERYSAALGPDVVVGARRVGPQEEDPAPALVAVDRADGEIRFELDGDTLARAAQLDPAEPLRWQVAGVGERTALLHVRPDPSDAADDAQVARDGSLVLIDLEDGAAITAVTGVGPLRTSAAGTGTGTDRFAVATPSELGPDLELLVVDEDGRHDGPVEPAEELALHWVGGSLFYVGPGVLGRTPQSPSPNATYARLADVDVRALTVTLDGRLAVLVSDPGGDEAVLLVTTPAADLAAGAEAG